MKINALYIVLLMLSLQWFSLESAGAKTIDVAYPSPSWNTSLPVSMAKEFGLFTSEGLEVQPVYVRGGPLVMAALLGGDADFAVIAGVTAVTSIQRGADIVIVGGHTAYIDQVLVGAKGIVRTGIGRFICCRGVRRDVQGSTFQLGRSDQKEIGGIRNEADT